MAHPPSKLLAPRKPAGPPPDAEGLLPGPLVAYRRLAAALVLRAVLDARDEGPLLAAPARRWLVDGGLHWATALDISPERVLAWADGLEPLPWEQLHFAMLDEY